MTLARVYILFNYVYFCFSAQTNPNNLEGIQAIVFKILVLIIFLVVHNTTTE